jgi:cytidylate kinase
MDRTRKGKRPTIAIDGPSGAGKSTVAKSLAERLGYSYVDTGAMYRAVALRARERGVILEDEKALSRWVSSLHIAFASVGRETHIFCDEKDITEAIRSPEISLLASDMSKRKGVREALVRMQRELGRGGGVVLEGRDIGTVVFPKADVKFYLDADLEERARRRYNELVRKGVGVDFRGTLEEVLKRDHNDMHRALSPLKRAEDAIFIDSTHRSAEEVVQQMVRIVVAKEEGSGSSSPLKKVQALLKG